MFVITVQGLRLTFNWMFENGSQLSTDDKYSGQNTSIFMINSVSQQDVALYRCQISNAAGTVLSASARLSLRKLLFCTCISMHMKHYCILFSCQHTD